MVGKARYTNFIQNVNSVPIEFFREERVWKFSAFYQENILDFRENFASDSSKEI